MSGSVRSPDAVSVVPAYEGPEGAALTSVAVGAHQTVGTAAVPGRDGINISSETAPETANIVIFSQNDHTTLFKS